MAEYLVTGNGAKHARGPLMGVILSFLDGGGIGQSWNDSTYAISSNEAMEAFRQRDVEGGKGALLEVSWLQKNATADTILRKCLFSVSDHREMWNLKLKETQSLSCATLEEAHTITSGILCSLSSECTPVGKDATDLLHNIIQIAILHFKEEITKTPTTMDKALRWLELGASTVSPIVSPVPSFEPDPALPRADPGPLLTCCHEWIRSAMWSGYSRETQMRLTRILGSALHASNSIMNSGRRIKGGSGAPLASTIVAARNDIIDSADQVIHVSSHPYNGTPH
jgi:hypothetical protein